MKQEPIRLHKTMRTLEVKDASSGQFSGYAVTFNFNVDGDVIAPGAFTKTLADKGPTGVPIFMHHDREQWVGSTTALVEDSKGLLMNAQLYLQSSIGRDAWGTLQGAMDAGFATGMSIGFIANVWQWDEETRVRTITEADMWEISITPWPANTEARVEEVYSIRTYERFIRDEAKCSAEVAKRIIAAYPLTKVQPSRDVPLSSLAKVARAYIAQKG